MFILLTVIVSTFILFLILQYFKLIAQDQLIGVTGPKCTPILGNIPQIRKDVKNKTVYMKMFQNFNQYGDTFRIRIGTKLILLTRDVKIIEGIVNNPKFVKSTDYNLLAEPWLGNGILLSSGERWHKLRKLMTPAFHFQILERFISIFESQIKVFIEKLKTLTAETINIAPMLHALSLDVMSESSMGVKLNAQTDPNSKFVAANQELLNLLPVRFWNQLYRYEPIWRLTSHYKRQTELITYVHNYVNAIIDERRNMLLASREKQNGDRQKPALLDILLLSEMDGEPLSNEIIQAEVNTLMFAGHETTGTTLGFVFYLLAKYPKIQEKLYFELKDSGIIDGQDLLTIRALNSNQLLDNVIKETLRLFPILPGAHKQCPEDIRIGDLFIPANTTISTAIYSNHHNPKHFKDPDEFIPERWDDEVAAKDRNPYAYQPFSAGLRNCIGQRFAMLEMKCVIVKLLRNFKLHLGARNFKVDLKCGLILYSANGILIKLETRNL